MDFAINADILFRDAYSLSDPAPELLKLIKFHPTRNTIAWLMTCYFQAVEKNPPRACALTSTLVTLRESPYGPIMQDGSTLERELRRELDYRFMLRFDEIDLAKHKFGRIGPSNPYLITCLLSALSLKYNLSSPSYVIHYQQSLPGLVTQCKSSICRVSIIGACIRLLTCGSIIIQSDHLSINSVNEIINRLKHHQRAGRLKGSNEQKVLGLTISHAEAGFKKENDVDDVWELIFPSDVVPGREKFTKSS